MIWNLGSINADHFYSVPRLPGPGETLAATAFRKGLGGKGANMSVAAARAAARVAHIGAVGPDGGWARDLLLEYGVDPAIASVKTPTGHANICIDPAGENNIVLFPGANREISEDQIGQALTEASPGDFLLLQNETNGQAHAARMAKVLGLRVVYAAAPFDLDAVKEVIGHVDLLLLNEVEAAQLIAGTGKPIEEIGVRDVVITLGAEGCKWVSNTRKSQHLAPAYKVTPVDTTGAGDTFTGYLVASLDRGLEMEDALDLAQRAAALMVMRRGTADVIPDLKDIQDHDFSA
ncbi:MAG: ribokinase [Pseudomonadota bacterium]